MKKIVLILIASFASMGCSSTQTPQINLNVNLNMPDNLNLKRTLR